MGIFKMYFAYFLYFSMNLKPASTDKANAILTLQAHFNEMPPFMLALVQVQDVIGSTHTCIFSSPFTIFNVCLPTSKEREKKSIDVTKFAIESFLFDFIKR